jgi:hypothetical protein
MWYESLSPGSAWESLWDKTVMCRRCGAFRSIDSSCPICGQTTHAADSTSMVYPDDGKPAFEVHGYVLARQTVDIVYIQAIEREWFRPSFAGPPVLRFRVEEMTEKATIVILFWSYFETRIERLIRAAARDVETRIIDDLLQRYSGIGGRLDRLFKVLFGTTYWVDLTEAGYGHIKEHLAAVQKARNDFAHGDPNAIDDALVTAVVANLKDEHEAWIAVYNKRVAKVPESGS